MYKSVISTLSLATVVVACGQTAENNHDLEGVGSVSNSSAITTTVPQSYVMTGARYDTPAKVATFDVEVDGSAYQVVYSLTQNNKPRMRVFQAGISMAVAVLTSNPGQGTVSGRIGNSPILLTPQGTGDILPPLVDPAVVFIVEQNHLVGELAGFSSNPAVSNAFNWAGLSNFDLIDGYYAADGTTTGGNGGECTPATSTATCDTADDSETITCECSVAICQFIEVTITIVYRNVNTGETWETNETKHMCSCACMKTS